MDGATKYVKGDATAGLVITFINLIGGTIMGVMNQGLGFADAIQQYGLLTIGDGLVSQIPSLLISLATGILVTKGSNEADFFRNFGQALNCSRIGNASTDLDAIVETGSPGIRRGRMKFSSTAKTNVKRYHMIFCV